MSRKKIILLGLFLIALYDLTAQVKLSVKEAVELALKQNIELEKINNELRGLDNTKTTLYRNVLPTVSLYNEAYKATGKTFDNITGMVQTESGRFLNSNFNVNWNALSLFSQKNDIKLARNRLNAKNQDLQGRKEFITFNVLQNFLEIHQGQKQGEIFKEFYDKHKRVLEITEESVKVGARAKQDLYAQKAELSRLEMLRLENENIINNRKNDLLLLLNLPPGSTIELPEQGDYSSANAYEKVEIMDLYKMALSKRMDLKSLETSVVENELLKAKTKENAWPEVNLFYNVGSNYSSFDNSKFLEQYFNNNITSNYGISLNVPIFNWFSNKNAIYQTEIIKENALLDIEKYKADIYTQLSNTLSNFETNKQRKVFSQEQLDATQKIYEFELEKYRLGSGDPLDLNIAQRNYIESTLKLIQTEFQLIFSRIELDYYSGKLEF